MADAFHLCLLLPHSDLELIGRYEGLAKEGEPIWEFLRDKWPYGIIDRAKNDIFNCGLTLDPKKANGKGYCCAEETIHRLGFSKADQAHVSATFHLAYQAFCALELIRNGEGCLSRTFAHTNWKHLDLALTVLQQNALIKQWLDPPRHYIHSLYDIVRKRPQEGDGAGTSDLSGLLSRWQQVSKGSEMTDGEREAKVRLCTAEKSQLSLE